MLQRHSSRHLCVQRSYGVKTYEYVRLISNAAINTAPAVATAVVAAAAAAAATAATA
jgi:hypothetical protein